MSDRTSVQSILQRIDSPIWIVTTAAGDYLGGLVATFVMKASIIDDDPRVIVGIGRGHATHDSIEDSGKVGLHLLRTDQSEVVAHFGMQSGHDVAKFADISHVMHADGVPILDDCAAWMTAGVEARYGTGDRTLFLCRVTDGLDVLPGPLMTTEAFVQSLDDARRKVLRLQLLADAEQDRIAVEEWRNKQAAT